MSNSTIVFYSDRLEIERAFNEWADKNGVAKVPNALVAFLEINGLLNIEKTVKWCRARRQEKQTEEGRGVNERGCPPDCNGGFCADYDVDCNACWGQWE